MSSEAFDGRRRAPWQREVGIASVLERWEDGRRGKDSADLKIIDVKTFPVVKKAA